MFRGVFNINMDAKGRMAMPTKLRDALNLSDEGKIVATVDTQNPCVLIYPLSHWEKIEEKILGLSDFNKISKSVKRLMLGNASDLEVAANGRVLLPANLRKHASLTKKMVLVGQGKNLELWDEDAWELENEQAFEQINSDDFEMPEELQGLNL